MIVDILGARAICRGIQDTRQIVDNETNQKENNDKKVGPYFLT